ncbi:DUF6153 family protein [Nocardia rhizosphaerae]|uniref:DUF6153 family protein n=1 Tax=Nocardia rhizosphaerae TaxID=1691571 RepID=A0ABV8L483_9NOCA
MSLVRLAAVIGHHPQQRAPGLAGVLALLALLAGIVAMHSTIFDTTRPGRAEHTGARSATTDVETRAAEYSPAAGHAPHHATVPTPRITGAGSGPHHEPAGTTPSGADQPFTATIGGNHATVIAAGPHRGAATGPAGGPGAEPAMATSGDAVRPVTVTTDQLTDPEVADAECGGSGNDEHAAVRPCVFVLVALTTALTLVLLYRLGAETAPNALAATRPWRGRRERPPPWTVLSLAQLAILRI